MSVERFFSTSESQQRLRAGPLNRAIDGFAAWLAIEGYARRSAAAKLRFVGNLSRWLEREELGVEALDEQRVAAFLARGLNRGRRGTATTGRQLLCYIGQILRHRHPETTQIYAKVDLDALRGLAPAWPGGAA